MAGTSRAILKWPRVSGLEAGPTKYNPSFAFATFVPSFPFCKWSPCLCLPQG